MKNNDDNLALFKMIGEFLSVHLVLHRNFSKKTVLSYKQSLNQFRLFIQEKKNLKITDINFDSFSQTNVYDFLIDLKETKKVSASTLNLRLSAIKSFMKYCGEQDLALASHYIAIKNIHNFRTENSIITKHLSENHLKLLFSLPDLATRMGRRNRFIMIFMYETGLRIQELLDLKLSSIKKTDNVNKVHVIGKGNKTRYIPLLDKTKQFVHQYISEFHKDGIDNPLIYTMHDGLPTKMKQGAIDYMLKKYATIAHEKDVTFPLNLHAHMFRHSIGMSMYKNGIPISYIKDFLGHVSINTTSIYSHADDSTIRSALEKISSPAESICTQDETGKKWKGKEQYLLELSGLI